jgi:hypothetical protein
MRCKFLAESIGASSSEAQTPTDVELLVDASGCNCDLVDGSRSVLSNPYTD